MTCSACLASSLRAAPVAVPRRSAATAARPGLARQRAGCACGGSCPRCAAQAVVADDPHVEREANRMADAALSAPPARAVRPLRPARMAGLGLPAGVGDVLARPGRALASGERTFFETRFGADLRAVRVHDDARAAASAATVGALAYAAGPHIVLGTGTSADRRLLAHELAHVVQQGRGGAAALRRQAIQPTCAGMPYDPLGECCCDDTITPGPGAATTPCAATTSRDNEYDGCSVPAWLGYGPKQKDNPGGAYDTWFSDPAIHGTQPRDFVPRLPCDVHDKCFQTCGSNRLACDQQLLRDSRAVCNNSRQRGRALQQCLEAVDAADFWLSKGSRGPFLERQREYCACCPVPLARGGATVYFETGSDTFDGAARQVLDDFVNANRALLSGGNFEMELIGQASRTGDPTANQHLSEQRIASVWLGIEARLGSKLDPQHVNPVALGESLAEREGAAPADNDQSYRSVQIDLRER